MTEPTELAEKANPCNVCKPTRRRTCESLGHCNVRDAWASLNANIRSGKLRWVEEARPATCPTCGSDKPKRRGVHRHIDPGTGDHLGDEECPDSFHATPTPVSDDAVREALDRVREGANGIKPDYLRRQTREHIATLEAAIHQRDERIGELTGVVTKLRQMGRTYVMGADVAGEQADYPVLPQDAHQADPLLEAVEQADRLLADEKKKKAAE